MAGPDPKIQIDITAKDDASKTIDRVATDVDKLDTADPQIDVTADTDAAVADLKDVDEAAGRLSHDDTVLVIKAQIDQAKGQLKELQSTLDDTGKHARDTAEDLDRIDKPAAGGGLRGNAIADLTGPLGEASSAASDFAGVFDGLGDAAEAAAGKLGLSEKMAGQLSSVIGGLGVAVAAGAALWSVWTNRQKEAKKAAEEHTKQVEELGRAIRDGNREAAVANFHKLYDDAIRSAGRFGLKQQEVTAFITGASDTLPSYTQRLAELDDQIAASTIPRFTLTLQQQRAELVATGDAVDKNRESYAGATTAADDKAQADNDLARQLGFTTDAQKTSTAAIKTGTTALDDARTAVDDLEHGYGRLHDRLSKTRAIEDFQTAMLDAQKTVRDDGKLTEDQVRAVQDSIVDAGEAAGLNPIKIQALISEVTPTDVNQAFLDTQAAIDAQPPLKIPTVLDQPKQTFGGSQSGPQSGPQSAPVNVTINVPPGARGVDVVRQVAGQVRRSGRRYGSPVVSYARRP